MEVWIIVKVQLWAVWSDGFCLSVCLSVCLSTFLHPDYFQWSPTEHDSRFSLNIMSITIFTLAQAKARRYFVRELWKRQWEGGRGISVHARNDDHQLYIVNLTWASFILVSFLTTLHANCCCVTLCIASSTSPEAPCPRTFQGVSKSMIKHIDSSWRNCSKCDTWINRRATFPKSYVSRTTASVILSCKSNFLRATSASNCSSLFEIRTISMWRN